MYVIVTYDWIDSTNIRIHALTPDLGEAERVYRVLVSSPKFTVTEQVPPCHIMIEMLEFPDSFTSESGASIFWNGSMVNKHPEVKVLFSNNRRIGLYGEEYDIDPRDSDES